MTARLTFIHALSPLHAGIGQGSGVIDLPIAREVGTGLPYLPGSSLKGVLRDACADAKDQTNVFGPPTNKADEHAGSVQFTDQRLLLLPVRSFRGTFAWCTSPFVLERFRRDAMAAGVTALPDVPSDIADDGCLISDGNTTIAHQIEEDGQTVRKVYLEDLDVVASSSDADVVTSWGTWLGMRVFLNDAVWQDHLTRRLCILHDDVFSFLADTAVEVIARVKLKSDTKTVEQGGLWYEEALPTESVLSGLVVATPTRKARAETYDAGKVLSVVEGLAGPRQFGGKSTVGRGLCRFTVTR